MGEDGRRHGAPVGSGGVPVLHFSLRLRRLTFAEMDVVPHLVMWSLCKKHDNE
jgi:hypothetical protein